MSDSLEAVGATNIRRAKMRQLLVAIALLCTLITPAAARYVTDNQVATSAKRYGVPLSVARAVIRMESGGRCDARGRAGELGPLQIKPATARGIGYRGPISRLRSCGAGLDMGMKHLAMALRRGSVAFHNAGIHARRLPPAARNYAMKVMRLARRA
jgi:soluble lytic murein transglycosylase-like protein